MKRNGRSTLAIVCLPGARCNASSAFAIVVPTAVTKRLRHMLHERATRLRACSGTDHLVPCPHWGTIPSNSIRRITW